MIEYVWTVQENEYESDIEGIFSSEEKARLYAKQKNGVDYRSFGITKWPLNPKIPERKETTDS